MWIKTQDNKLVNLDHVTDIVIKDYSESTNPETYKTEGAFDLMAFSASGSALTLGTYKTLKSAEQALRLLENRLIIRDIVYDVDDKP